MQHFHYFNLKISQLVVVSFVFSKLPYLCEIIFRQDYSFEHRKFDLFVVITLNVI
jgi:hypothetical protein